MGIFPDYLGVKAFGVKMGVILAGDDIVEETYKAVKKCNSDGLIDDGDILCLKESIVARAQNNYVSKDEIAKEVRKKLGLKESDYLGILYPIASRNRFAPILEGLAKAVPKGKVIIQFSYPRDCVGNQVVAEGLDGVLGVDVNKEEIIYNETSQHQFGHPATGVNYLGLYRKIVQAEGAQVEIILSNNHQKIIDYKVDGLIVSCIHERRTILEKIKNAFPNVITLQDLCDDRTKKAWSEWGVLGTNMHSSKEVKLAPRETFDVARKIQSRVMKGIRKKVEVTIYGDGAYMDPTTKIYELADPVCSFGFTDGLYKRRCGIKYKYFVGKLFEEGKGREEIENIIERKKQRSHKIDDICMEGTTPRKMEDISASLADLISGSADAGTPLVILKDLL